jgi:predicted GNAT family N-acyltransferase
MSQQQLHILINLNIAVFGDNAPCSFAEVDDVSEVLTSTIFRVIIRSISKRLQGAISHKAVIFIPAAVRI